MNTLIYGVLGQIGSGKTTYARQLAIDKKAIFFSMDLSLAKLGVPISSYSDYEKLYPGVNAIIKDIAKQALLQNIPVVFDYGVNRPKGRMALRKLAESCHVDIELHHLIVPTEERRRRVQTRNQKKPSGIFSFEINENEFNFISTVYSPPMDDEGFKVITIKWSQNETNDLCPIL